MPVPISLANTPAVCRNVGLAKRSFLAYLPPASSPSPHFQEKGRTYACDHQAACDFPSHSTASFKPSGKFSQNVAHNMPLDDIRTPSFLISYHQEHRGDVKL